MSVGFLGVAACAPILLALVLMVWLHWPATRAMPMAWAACALIALVVWKMPLGFILAATLGGFGNTLNILIIILGAIVLLFSLRESGGMETIKQGIGNLSDDKRVQIILIAFLFSAFLEGAAGFGTPAAIAAPLMINLGFPALAAVMACLILNSFSVTFGVIGAVVWFGLKNLTPLIDGAISQGVAPASIPNAWGFFELVGRWGAVLNIAPIFVLPLFVLCFVTRYFGVNRSWREGLGAWKISLFASTCFALAYLFFAFVLGIEFPSLMGGLIALAMVVFAIRKQWFIPPETWSFGPKEQWEAHWIGSIEVQSENHVHATMSQARAWMPYVLIGLLLLLTRLSSLPFKSWVMGVDISVSAILGYESVQFSIKPLYLPGIMPFMLVALLIVPLHGMSWKKAGVAWADAFRRIKGPAIALLFAVALVEIFKQSAHNAMGYPSMPLSMAKATADLVGGAWPFFASFIGALGAFITGSNTVSNLLFSEFQYGLAEQLHLSRQIIVALQLVGGSMGNMVCIHNIVAASAVVGLSGMEGAIIKRNVVPMLIYGLSVGCLGMLFCYVLFPAIF
ncbi:MAG: L-lactate permease [Desulfatibacillum sp.]|nr:L-lactate permease [Desulfatibacillum sp.]